ncbi:MAG: glycoside hydrolase family 127 protein [Treponema sp.]|nr:glycoside hydrolase family 127 protein [Treponema sp.]
MNIANENRLKKAGADDDSVLYFGNWERGRTASAYSRCYFSFYGGTVKAYAIAGPGKGICSVLLDGEYQAAVDCYGEREETICIFEKSGIPGAAAHNLVVIAGREKNERSTGAALEIAGFAAEAPVNYPGELKRRMNTEYAAIRKNLKPWKDPGQWRPVPYAAVMPERGVRLLPGIVRNVYDKNIENIKYNAALPDYCEGEPMDFLTGEARSHAGWSGWLPGSNEGRMLAGAAGALRWEEDGELRAIVNRIIGDIKARMRDDGYFNYYPEEISYVPDHTMEQWADHTQTPNNDAVFSERKNYDRVFWTRGMLAAMAAGNPDAPALLRRMYDWFNKQEQHLTHILLGGNSTNGTPGGPLVYHSAVGKPDDIITSMRYFDQDYWFAAFAERQPLAFSHYPGERPHCYALLPLEALADEYRATGDQKYLDALLGAWDIYHDHYKHAGGPTAICEMHGPYPPGTRYITTGHNGETCGSVFWGWINQRLAQLYPREEKYIAQIEEVVYNTLCNCRDKRGHTRYHIRLHGKKDGAGNSNSCCQVSSTMAISSIPQYIYLASRDTVFVNLFIPSEFDSEFGKLTMLTDFPASGAVTIRVDPARDGERFAVSLRAPHWINGSMAVSVNGSFAASASAGGRITLNRPWRNGDTISFTIPYGFRLVHYTGTDQAEGPRYTLLYGPLLMALAADCRDAGTVPRIRRKPEDLAASLKPAPDKPLHFPVPGTAYTYLPYWDAGDEGFTCLPVIEE